MLLFYVRLLEWVSSRVVESGKLWETGLTHFLEWEPCIASHKNEVNKLKITASMNTSPKTPHHNDQHWSSVEKIVDLVKDTLLLGAHSSLSLHYFTRFFSLSWKLLQTFTNIACVKDKSLLNNGFSVCFRIYKLNPVGHLRRKYIFCIWLQKMTWWKVKGKLLHYITCCITEVNNSNTLYCLCIGITAGYYIILHVVSQK